MKLDLDALFKLFEEIEPTLKEKETSQKEPAEITTEEKTVKMPRLHISEEWGEVGSPDRNELIEAIKLASGGEVSSDPYETLTKLEQGFLSLEKRVEQKISSENPGQALSQLVVLDTINRLFNSFQASPLGFINEAFIAALYGGEQIKLHSQEDDRDKNQIGDVKLKDGTPVSIKTIKPNGNVYGSIENLKKSIEGSPNKVVFFDIFTKQYDGNKGKVKSKVIGIKAYRFKIDEQDLQTLGSTLQEAEIFKQIDYGIERLPEIIKKLKDSEWQAEKDDLQYLKNMTFSNSIVLPKLGEPPRSRGVVSNQNRLRYVTLVAEEVLQNEQDVNKFMKLYNDSLQDKKTEYEITKEPSIIPAPGVGNKFMVKNWMALANKQGGKTAEINISKERLETLVRESLLLLGESIVSLFNQVDTFSRLIDTYLRSNDPNRNKIGNEAVSVAKEIKPATQKVVGQKE